MEASKIKEILKQHRFWINGNGGTVANLSGADLSGADLTGAIGLPDVSWVIPGCLAQLNQIKSGA
ncbi:MAG: pentapeptide repeat-containing protein, partial [Bacteroidota bacterium]